MRIESPLQIEHDGARLFSTTLGSGPDVVLLHPTPVHHDFWLPVADRLAERYRLTLIDLRGHGQSSAGAGTISMARLAEDVHAVLAALNIQHAAFVGCSIGTYTLYEYWRRFPQQMAAFVCTCGKPQPDSAANRDTRRESMQAAQQPGGLEKFFDRMADTLIGPTARQHHPVIRNGSPRHDEYRVPARDAGRTAGPDGAPGFSPDPHHHQRPHLRRSGWRRPEQHATGDARHCRARRPMRSFILSKTPAIMLPSSNHKSSHP